MRLLVFGGRGYNHGGTTFMALDHLRAQLGVEVIIHGAAPGADQLAGVYARANSGMSEDPYPADWDNLEAPGAVIVYRKDGKPYNLKAGFTRNQRMIDEGKPDMGLQFPGGAGTADMRRRLDKAGIPVIQVYAEMFGAPAEIRTQNFSGV